MVTYSLSLEEALNAVCYTLVQREETDGEWGTWAPIVRTAGSEVQQ
jgi:hypothetical protein